MGPSIGPTAFTNPPVRPPTPERAPPRRRALWGLVAGGVCVLAAVAWIWMARPEMRVVSGRAQPKTTDSGHPVRWRKGQVPITVDASVEALGRGATDAVIQSFGNWLSGDAATPRFQFDVRPPQPVSRVPDGENRVYFAPIDIEGHEHDLAVTVSHLDESSGAILEADIILNSRQPLALVETEFAPAHESTPPDPDEAEQGGDSDFPKRGGTEDDPPTGKARSHDARSPSEAESNEVAEEPTTGRDNTDSTGETNSELALERIVVVSDCVDRYDLESVLTHEVGHFLGLGEDMTDSEATMYARTGRCEINKRHLTESDLSSVSELYAEPFAEASNSPGVACAVRSGRRSGVGSDWAVGAGLVLIALRLRRNVRG